MDIFSDIMIKFINNLKVVCLIQGCLQELEIGANCKKVLYVPNEYKATLKKEIF